MTFELTTSYGRFILTFEESDMDTKVRLSRQELADLADELCNELHGCSISEMLDEVSELKDEKAALQTALDDTKDRLDQYE